MSVNPAIVISEETCSFPLCRRKATRQNYCGTHGKYFASPKPPKPKTPIKKVSDKRAKERRVRKKLTTEKYGENPLCMIKSPECTGYAEGFDHVQKSSPANYALIENNIPACNACNGFKERFPKWAEQNGFAKSRFKK